MSRSALPLVGALALSAAAFLSGCDGGSGNPTDPNGNGQTPTISISLSSSSINVTAVTAGEVTVTLTRGGGFTGAVTVNADAPSGVTVLPATIAVGATTGTLTFQVAGSVAAGTLQATVRANGQGVQQASANLQILVAPAPVPDFTLALNPATLAVQQGQAQTTQIQITRSGGFTGAVTLSATGVPGGVTAAFDPASPAGTTSTLTLTASAGATTGAATVTVTGTASGVADRTVDLGLTVSDAGGSGGGNAAWAFCDEIGIPVWFAFRDGNGPWTRVQADAQNVFRFQIDEDRGSIAWVEVDGAGWQTQVFHYARAELTTVGDQCGGPGGLKTVNGSVQGLGLLESAFISLGSSGAAVSVGGSPNFVLNQVPDGSQDLVAARAALSTTTFTLEPNSIIIRRDLNPPDNSTLAPLDFGTEGFAPASANVTVSGLTASEMAVLSGIFTTARGGLGSYFSGISGGASQTYYGVPTPQLASGDLHYLQVVSVDTAGAGGGTPPETRQVGLAFREVQDRAAAMGPSLATTTVSTVATAPYARLRAEWSIQAQYDRFVYAAFVQSGGIGSDDRSVLVGATSGYLGGSATADLAVPDLSGVAGWDNAWGLMVGASTVWTVSGSGWQGSGVINFPDLVEGTQFFSATRSGQITP